MKSNHLRIPLMCLAVAFFTWGARDAGAASVASPATICRAQGQGGITNYNDRGALFNLETASTLVAVCPLHRRNTTSINGLSSLKIGVQNGDASVGTGSCTARSVDTNGNVLKAVTRTWSGPGLAKQVLDFGSTLNVSAVDSVYVVTCTLPIRNGTPSHTYGLFWLTYSEP